MSEKNDGIESGSHAGRPAAEDGSCSPGCCCHASGGPGRTRWFLGAVILALAAVLAVRAVIRSTAASGQSSMAAAGFAAAAEAPAAAAEQPAAAVVETPPVSPASATPEGTEPAAPAPAPAEGVAAQTPASVIGTEIAAISDLNRLAGDMTGVFVFFPSGQADGAAPPRAPMEAAARAIAAQGMKVGLFTLKAGTPDYDQIATQVSAPGVLALVKGRGMKAVSGEVTETRLVQAFVAASAPAGGCCGGGADASGCR